MVVWVSGARRDREVIRGPMRERDSESMPIRNRLALILPLTGLVIPEPRRRRHRGTVGFRRLLQLNLPVGQMLMRVPFSGGLGCIECHMAFVCRSVGTFDGPQAGGDPHLASGDGLAVAAAEGAFGKALAELLDLADMGF